MITPAAQLPARLRELGLEQAPYAEGQGPELPRLLGSLWDRGADASGRDLVIVIDGLGWELLLEHYGETPTLRSLRGQTRRLATVAPATTATALASFLLGVSPLEHGIIGYRALDGADGPSPSVFSNLQGADATVRDRWSLAEGPAARDSARPALQIAPEKHRGSLLSRAVLPGFTMVPWGRREDRVDTTIRALRRAPADALVYLHLDDVDHAGHRYGPGSTPWREALADVDAILGALLRRLPVGTRIQVTADHGMVPAPPETVIDLAREKTLDQPIQLLAGDARAPMMRMRGGSQQERAERAAAVATTLVERTEGNAIALDRAGILESGLLGPDDVSTPASLRGRLGDLMVLFAGTSTLTDSRLRRADQHPEAGVHGSLTSAEMHIPHLQVEL